MLNGSGLRVEEERGPEESIARLQCARTAFVGRTLRGPVNQPIAVDSFAEFQHVFGGLWQPSPLGYAVEQFFDNGGRDALVVRVVNAARSATVTLKAGAATLNLRARRPGTREFLRVSVDYDNLVATEFNLTVQRVRMHGTAQVEDQEIFPRLSIVPGAARYIGTIIVNSELVDLVGPVPAVRPDETVETGSGGGNLYVSSNSDGDDGAPLTDYDLIGSEVARTGLFALDGVDYFNFLCIPPLSRDQDVGPGILLIAERYCRKRRAMLVVDPPAAWQTADDALTGMRQWNFSSDNALMYFPRILAHDKLRGQFESFAPCGAVAGMLARADVAQPVWGPPRVDEPILRPGYRPSCLVTEDKRLRLAALGVNTLLAVRAVNRLGIQPRTLAAGTAAAPDWQRLGSRRLALFILNSIERGTRWTILTRSGADVGRLAAAQVQDFFEGLHTAGAFGARSAAESFFVICDQRMNPADSAVPNSLQMLVGFAAVRSGEFHCFRVSQSAAGSKVTPVSLNRLTLGPQRPADFDWGAAPSPRLDS